MERRAWRIAGSTYSTAGPVTEPILACPIAPAPISASSRSVSSISNSVRRARRAKAWPSAVSSTRRLVRW
jgi:hypothetical protein